MKKLLLLLVGVGVTVGSFYWSMKDVEFDVFLASLKTANYFTLPFLLLLLFVFYWLKSMRWSWMLRPVKELSAGQLFPPVMTGFAANNLLPAHLGEFVRVFLVGRRHQLPMTTVLSTVVLERVFDVMAILGLFVVSLQFAGPLPDGFNQAAMTLAVLSAIFVICATAFLIWTDGCIRLFEGTLRFVRVIPQGLADKLVAMVKAAGDGLHSLRSFRAIVAIAFNSLIQWVCNGLIAWLALKAFHVDVAPTDGLIITAMLAIAVMIPSTPGYFGVIQLAFGLSIEALGIEANESHVFAASMYYHISMYIPVTISGLYFLNREGLSLRDLSSISEKSEKSDDTEEAGLAAE